MNKPTVVSTGARNLSPAREGDLLLVSAAGYYAIAPTVIEAEQAIRKLGARSPLFPWRVSSVHPDTEVINGGLNVSYPKGHPPILLGESEGMSFGARLKLALRPHSGGTQ